MTAIREYANESTLSFRCLLVLILTLSTAPSVSVLVFGVFEYTLLSNQARPRSPSPVKLCLFSISWINIGFRQKKENLWRRLVQRYLWRASLMVFFYVITLMCKSFTSRALASLISDEDDFFSMQTSAREPRSFWRKRHRHPATVFCENVVLAEASYQILEFLSFCYWERA